MDVLNYHIHMNKESRFIKLASITRSIHILAVVLLAVAVYFNALWNGFVYDDIDQVVRNNWIRDVSNIPAIFKTGAWGFKGYISNYYRPMMHLLYTLEYQVFGLAPWGFHLVNILFHAANCLLVFMVTERLLRESPELDRNVLFSVPFMTAVVFAVHPVHTEPVTWVAGVPDLTYVFFLLLSFYLYTVSRRKAGHRYKWAMPLSAASFFIAMFCKEPAVILPAILIVYDHVVEKHKDRPVAYLRRYIPYILALSVYFIVRFLALGGFSPDKPHWRLSAYQYFINIFPLFGGYIEKLALPLNLNAHYIFHPASSVLDASVLLPAAMTVGFLLVLFMLLNKRSLSSIGLILIMLPLLPALYIRGVGKNVFTERYLYLPVFGYGLLLSMLICGLVSRKPGFSKVLAAGFIGLTVLYSAGTINRNVIWRDEYTLWSDTVKKSPDGSIPHDAFGVTLYDKGLIDEAIVEYKKSVRLDSDNDKPHVDLSSAYIKKGMLNEALEECGIALAIKPDDELAHRNLGIIYAEMGQLDKAVEELQAAIVIDPYSAEAHNNLGNAYGRIGQIDQSIEQLREAIRINPEYIEAHFNLGVSYSIMGQTDQAVQQFETVLKLDPKDSAARENLEEASRRNK